MELKRVVITGLGAVTPIGNNIKDFWNNLINGVSGSDMITHFNTEKFKTKFACEVKNFNPEDYYDRKEARRLDMFTIFAMVATDEAVRDSGMDLDKIDHDRVGVIYGSGIGGFGTFHTELRNFIEGDGTPRFNPFFIPKIIPDITAGHISMRYGFRGPNYATVSACATSTHGIIDAFNLIRLDKANIIIAGGSEAAINEPGVAGFNAMQALSTNNENYKTASRPFDASRDGFVMGEGSGSVVLEELEHAKARGARIYAELAGGGMTADAYHITQPQPDGLGAASVMKLTIEDGNLKPEDIDYVNVHGTATPRGDIAEANAIVKVFG
jgi:3-oxoacyl-[acyl-carrier-protein] synthase II